MADGPYLNSATPSSNWQPLLESGESGVRHALDNVFEMAESGWEAATAMNPGSAVEASIEGLRAARGAGALVLLPLAAHLLDPVVAKFMDEHLPHPKNFEESVVGRLWGEFKNEFGAPHHYAADLQQASQSVETSDNAFPSGGQAPSSTIDVATTTESPAEKPKISYEEFKEWKDRAYKDLEEISRLPLPPALRRDIQGRIEHEIGDKARDYSGENGGTFIIEIPSSDGKPPLPRIDYEEFARRRDQAIENGRIIEDSNISPGRKDGFMREIRHEINDLVRQYTGESFGTYVVDL